MNRSVIIAVVAVVVLGVGGYLVFHKSSPAPASSTSTQTAKPANTQSGSSTTDDTNAAATITYTDSGFSPATLTVKSGTTVTIRNNSSGGLEFDSDPHPEHTDDPELNIGTVAPGQSTTFTPNVTGTHGYHNHINSSDTGTLIVQ